MDFAFSTACCKYESILPRSPLYRVDRRVSLDLVDYLPVIDLDFLPDPDASVVATCSNDIFELGVCPADLPARP